MLPQDTRASIICITMTKKADWQFGYSLWEVEVYPGGPGRTNLVDKNCAGRSTVQDEGAFPSRYAVDGRYDTRWGSDHGEEQSWLAVCLTAKQEISNIDLYWESAYATEYSISVR